MHLPHSLHISALEHSTSSKCVLRQWYTLVHKCNLYRKHYLFQYYKDFTLNLLAIGRTIFCLLRTNFSVISKCIMYKCTVYALCVLKGLSHVCMHFSCIGKIIQTANSLPLFKPIFTLIAERLSARQLIVTVCAGMERRAYSEKC